MLAPLIYEELHRIASRLFRGERSDHTLRPTALVHEAFCRLIDAKVSWQNRAHFYALSARRMRRLRVNHANERRAAKRGRYAVRVTLTDLDAPAVDAAAVLLDLDAALTSLAEVDARKAEIVQLQYFRGLTFQQLEEVTGLSSSTLDRELRFSRVWRQVQAGKGGLGRCGPGRPRLASAPEALLAAGFTGAGSDEGRFGLSSKPVMRIGLCRRGGLNFLSAARAFSA